MKRIKLSEARDEYSRHSKARGLEVSTITNQRTAINQLIKVLGDVQLGRVCHNDLDVVFSSHDWAPRTRNNRVGQYKAFFRWARSRGYTDGDPLFGWRLIRVPDQERTRVPVAEWPKLFAVCDHPQERIVLALGLYLFLRTSEMSALQLRHVNLQESLIEIWRPKTKQRDTMPISSELDAHLRQWMTYLAEQGFSAPDNFLVGARRRQDFSEVDATKPFSHAHRTVQRILVKAGYPTRQEGGHTLRRSGARAYFDELVSDGYDGALRRVQSMLGHSHSIMTEVYLGLDLDRQQRNQDLAGKPMFQHGEVRVLRGVNREAL